MNDVQESSKLKIQLCVLRALWMREIITRYGRTIGGYLWAIAEPAAMIIILSAIFGFLARRPPLGESFALFFATGYIGFMFYKTTADFASLAIRVNRPLFIFPRVTPFDALIVRVYLQFITTSAVAVVIFTSICIMTGDVPEFRPGYIMLAIAAGTLMGTAAAFINSVLFLLVPTWERIFAVINRPLFILSGIFFLPEGLPPFAKEALSWNPVIHVVSLFRMGFYPEYNSAVLDYSYLFFFTLTAFFVGMLLVHKQRFAASEL